MANTNNKNKLQQNLPKKDNKYKGKAPWKGKHKKSNWKREKEKRIRREKLQVRKELAAKQLAEAKNREVVQQMSTATGIRVLALRVWRGHKVATAHKRYKALRAIKTPARTKIERAITVLKWLRKRPTKTLRRSSKLIRLRQKNSKNCYIVRRQHAMQHKNKLASSSFCYKIKKENTHLRVARRPYSPSVSGLWNFLESYRKYQGRWLTQVWRERYLKGLAVWVRQNVRLRGISRYFVLDTIYRVLQRATTRFSPEEHRIRLVQRRLVRWARKARVPARKTFSWIGKALKLMQKRAWRTATRTTDARAFKKQLRRIGGVTENLHKNSEAKRLRYRERAERRAKRRLRPRSIKRKLVSKKLAKKNRIKKMRRLTLTKRQKALVRGAYDKNCRKWRTRFLQKKHRKSTRKRFAYILWNFISPERRFIIGGFPPKTRKGLRPTTKQLGIYLKKMSWTDFSAWPAHKEGHARFYANRKAQLSKEDLGLRTQKVKRLRLEYRERRGRRRRQWKRRARRKVARKVTRIKAVKNQIPAKQLLSKLNKSLKKRVTNASKK